MMEQHLFILVFFTGFVSIVLSDTHKYYLVQQGRNWTDARTSCQATYTDLAIVKSNYDLVQIQNEAQSKQFTSSAWIGMYLDMTNWHWSLGYEQLGSTRKWRVGAPSNNNGHKNCGAMTPSGWLDLPCTEFRPFICFDETNNGSSRYIYITDVVQWKDAQAYCRANYTDLTSARDETENSIILNLISGYTWFGLMKDPWQWVDQTNFSIVSWMKGQPDNMAGNEFCGYFNMTKAGDLSCSTSMPFICYSVITKQQIIRMKIQSTQDLNNPAVNTAILETFMQKLKGIITVKWKVKPDGSVFHKENETNTS